MLNIFLIIDAFPIYNDKTTNVAVVTGSSSGIRLETSVLLAKNEFYTYIRMRSLDRAKAIVGIAHNQGLPFQVVQLDVDGKIH
jgi:NAD(P)-dependent dehydrogenase (short-subunit alcohol dehydrogenase family)